MCINFNNYIINDTIINNKSTIHIHSINVDYTKCWENERIMIMSLKNIKYIDFLFNYNDFIELC